MTFNEDVSVADVFDKVYRLVLGQEKQGGSIIEIFLCDWPAGGNPRFL